MKADFSGYATKNGLKCSDGRTIMPGAFKHSDKQKVPLVWQHQHNESTNVLGHAVLENRDDGVYAYGFFNDTASALNAKSLVQHKDITALSIYANQLVQQGQNVLHGDIKELSLVLSGANPGAFIDNINLQHGDTYETLEDEAIIYTGLSLEHEDTPAEKPAVDNSKNESDQDKTVKDVFDSMTEEQKNVVYFMIGEAVDGVDSADSADTTDTTAQHGDIQDATVKEVFDSMTDAQQKVVHFMLGEAINSKDTTDITHNQEGTDMTRNVFEQNGSATGTTPTLTHDQIQTIVTDGIKFGSFKESFLQHAVEYGIENIDLLFPDARALATTPELIARQAEWVPKVLGATKHSPFARIKSLAADLTAEEARAKGYIKGTLKKEEVISLLRRTTAPTTVYKKQKLDRDDIIDITDFDVITWLKWEIRFMLNEEVARAILIGDGRSAIHADKIKDPAGVVDGTGIRSIANDNEIYAHQVQLAANVSASVTIDEVTRARTAYRGSGSPTYYTTDKNLVDLLLLKDKMGRRLYGTEAELASALRVKEIVAVEVLEEIPEILGIIVNLIDYTVGADKGGEISFFEDFDIDFNQNKYLLETRISGALTKPKSAIVIRRALGTLAVPAAPSFAGLTNTITVPTVTGVDYRVNDIVVTGAVIITEDTDIVAEPTTDYYFAPNTTATWTFVYTAA